ncbi:MAG: hypothetical protein CM1200mP14_28300 [Gammaproteobacteria bacterium]|nr:MAG: hypothetical protein CM1200mP14_28300 [Gammaproteobacteria bacterium]
MAVLQRYRMLVIVYVIVLGIGPEYLVSVLMERSSGWWLPGISRACSTQARSARVFETHFLDASCEDDGGGCSA